MARQTFRLNLSSSEFPFLSSLYGRSIVYPQQDMHYIRPNAFTGTEADHNIGIPQMIFCENVMPASYGYQSVGFFASVPAFGPIQSTAFDQAFYLRDISENRTLFVPGPIGVDMQRYTWDAGTGFWNTSPKVTPAGAKVTVANLKGRTFIHAEFDDEFWEWTGAWNDIVFTGITAANIKGIVAANSYLILYDNNTLYWSSTVDPIDFVPSLATGAGSQRVLSNKGRIVVCHPIEDGFIIHTTTNAIIAKYSNNIRFPWVFKELKNSAGLADKEHASIGGDGINTYAFTTNGLMSYGPIKADQIHPSVNEFLGCRQMEQWNSTTKNIDLLTLIASPLVKLSFVANRWLVISYGATSLTHALIFDVGLKRWGKIRIDHVDAFEFFGNAGTSGATTAITWAGLSGTWLQQNNSWADYGAIISGGAASLTIPYRSIAFLGKDGSVKVVNFDLSSTGDTAIMLIGRIQFLRNNLWTITDVEAESVGIEAQTKMSIWSSLDGLSFSSKIYPFKEKRVGNTQRWAGRITAINHSLAFEGNFNMNSILARGLIAGKR